MTYLLDLAFDLSHQICRRGTLLDLESKTIADGGPLLQSFHIPAGALKFDISIADFAILGWAWRHERHQVDLADFPNVKRWYETMMARPGVQRGFAVALS